MAIKREALDRLVEQAKNDPAFFHGLVFKPEETLAKIDYLDRAEKAKILELSPEDVIAGLAGVRACSATTRVSTRATSPATSPVWLSHEA